MNAEPETPAETPAPDLEALDAEITGLMEQHDKQVTLASNRNIERSDYAGMANLLNAYETAHTILYNIYVKEIKKKNFEIEKVTRDCASAVNQNISEYTASKAARTSSFDNALKGIRPLQKFTRVGGKGKFKYTKRK